MLQRFSNAQPAKPREPSNSTQKFSRRCLRLPQETIGPPPLVLTHRLGFYLSGTLLGADHQIHTAIHVQGSKFQGLVWGFMLSSTPLEEYYTPAQMKELGSFAGRKLHTAVAQGVRIRKQNCKQKMGVMLRCLMTLCTLSRTCMLYFFFGTQRCTSEGTFGSFLMPTYMVLQKKRLQNAKSYQRLTRCNFTQLHCMTKNGKTNRKIGRPVMRQVARSRTSSCPSLWRHGFHLGPTRPRLSWTSISTTEGWRFTSRIARKKGESKTLGRHYFP